jgi:hypothetical protein
MVLEIQTMAFWYSDLRLHFIYIDNGLDLVINILAPEGTSLWVRLKVLRSPPWLNRYGVSVSQMTTDMFDLS